MRNKKYIILLIILTSLVSINAIADSDPVRDSLSMGTSYANDLYYSFETGEVSSIERDNWEIAFYTPGFSVGIITNGGLGIRLYNYPNGDTSDWSSIDTTGFYNWKLLINSTTKWEEGAFNRSALGHPDYGWGIYDMSNHHIVGDSIFILDSPLSGLKKLWIIEKDAVQNIYRFRFANLDGTNEHEVELDISSYSDKRFAYYSLTNNQSFDREPDSDRWDMLFTKYWEMVPNNEGDFSPYIVTGVLNNVDVASNEFHPVGPDFVEWNSKPMDSVINNIGYDWKILTPEFSWEIKDSNYYFVQNYSGSIYKIWFEWWGGSSTGDFSFFKQFLGTVSVNEIESSKEAFSIFPNPASNSITIQTPIELNGNYILQISDQTGRKVFSRNLSDKELNNELKLSNLNLNSGFYIITISGKEYSNSQTLIIQ